MSAAKPTASETAQEALAKAEAALELNTETNRMVKEMHAAWMQPHAGYGDRSLLQCVSQIVTEASADKIVGERLVWYAKVVGALSALGGAFWWGVK
ncbi:MAG: hypothetical protein ACRCYS_10575 [Beijerinckiaceae bacterium]